MIPFNQPCIIGKEMDYIHQSIASGKLCGDGPFSQQCQQWFIDNLNCQQCLLTPSCTAALEMAALLLELKPGDEVIMPSFTFSSCANAFALRGAQIVFVDVDPATMNLDAACVAQAINAKTKAILMVHYAGVACDIAALKALCESHDLWLIEDAAQGLGAYYQDKPLGSFGDLATFSFHQTKNITSGGEGGALIINHPNFVKRAEVIREKGTDRSLFLRGEVDKYSWVDIGSSYLPSELQAAFLLAQLNELEQINQHRIAIWQRYTQEFSALVAEGLITLPQLPPDCRHNGHIFYFLLDGEYRQPLMAELKAQGVGSAFHFVPLHSSKAGLKFGRFFAKDRYTTWLSEQLLRLPLWYPMSVAQVDEVIAVVKRCVRQIVKRSSG